MANIFKFDFGAKIRDLVINYNVVLKKSQLYRNGAYTKARPLGRNLKDYQSHFYCFLIDINICLLPVYLWVIEFLLILCGIIPPLLFDFLFYIMYAFLFITGAVLLGVFTASTRGQTIGGSMSGLKLVQRNKKEASPLILILRQALGFGIPIVVFGYFFQIFGILVWWILTGIVILSTPNQQTLFDLLFGLVHVVEPDYSTIEPKRSAKAPVAQPVQPVVQPQQPVVQPAPVVVQPVAEPVQIPEGLCPVDLHIRSNYSDDGTHDVEEIFRQAKEIGMEVISITDHNCARANAAAGRFAQLYNIQYIPGVELDGQFQGVRIRVLGYYVDWNNPVFEEFEKQSLKREKNISMLRVKKFEEYSGIGIDVDSIISSSRFQTITPDDITKMVFNNKTVRELPMVQKYIKMSKTEREARARFKHGVFGTKGPCYVQGDYPDIRTLIDAIHNAHGIAILSSWHMDTISDDGLEVLLNSGFDGVECFSPLVKPQTMASLLKKTKKHRGFITCGSDYHGGQVKPNFKLGKTNCPDKVLPIVRVITKAAQ